MLKVPLLGIFAIFLIFFYPWLALSLLVGPIKITLFSDPTFLVLWSILILALLFFGVRGMQANDLVKRGFGFGSAYAAVVLVFLNWGLGLPEVDTTKFGEFGRDGWRKDFSMYVNSDSTGVEFKNYLKDFKIQCSYVFQCSVTKRKFKANT